MTNSIVSSDALEGKMRMDAEYYQPEWFAFLKATQKLGAKRLSNVASLEKRPFERDTPTFSYIQISGIDTQSGAVEPIEIPTDEAPSRAQWEVATGDVLFSTVRPLRNAVALIDDELDGAICSSGFAVLRPEGIDPEVLFAYLKTDQMRLLAHRYTTATMYPAIAKNDILNLPVVLPAAAVQKEVSKSVRKAQKMLRASVCRYRDAEAALLEFIEWDSVDLSPSSFWVSDLEATVMGQRSDSEHFDPLFARIVDHLKSYDSALNLDQVAETVRRGKQPTYVEGGEVLAINSEHVGTMFVNETQAERTDNSSYQASESAHCLHHDVLLNSTGVGTIGRANCAMHHGHSVVDNHVTVIRVDDVDKYDPRYLALFLNSPAGRFQTEQWISGSSGQVEIYPSDIRRFVVAWPDSETQAKFGRELTKSYNERKSAASELANAVGLIQGLLPHF